MIVTEIEVGLIDWILLITMTAIAITLAGYAVLGATAKLIAMINQ